MTATLAEPRQGQNSIAVASASRRARALISMMAWLYLTVLACLGLWVTVTVVVFGWDPNLTTSGSMEPSLRPGDVVLTSPIGTEPLGVGSVVVFNGPNGNVIHRVTAVELDGAYRTRGDANADEDPVAVQPEQVVGTGRLLVPMIGLPAYWFTEGQTLGFGGWLTLTLGALVMAPNPNRTRRRA